MKLVKRTICLILVFCLSCGLVGCDVVSTIFNRSTEPMLSDYYPWLNYVWANQISSVRYMDKTIICCAAGKLNQNWYLNRQTAIELFKSFKNMKLVPKEPSEGSQIVHRYVVIFTTKNSKEYSIAYSQNGILSGFDGGKYRMEYLPEFNKTEEDSYTHCFRETVAFESLDKDNADVIRCDTDEVIGKTHSFFEIEFIPSDSSGVSEGDQPIYCISTFHMKLYFYSNTKFSYTESGSKVTKWYELANGKTIDDLYTAIE